MLVTVIDEYHLPCNQSLLSAPHSAMSLSEVMKVVESLHGGRSGMGPDVTGGPQTRIHPN